jgi:DNA-binding PadR family transcriptional regulator
VPRRDTLTLTEAAVLALLRIEGERSGYDLLKLAGQAIGHVWAPAKSQLYTTLRRLVGAGLVRSRKVVQAARPDKQLFRLTKAGEDALAAWLAEVEPGARDSFYLKVFVGGLMPREQVAAHVEQYRADTEGRLELYRALEATNTRRGHDWFHHLMLRHAIGQATTALAWADETLIELRARSARAATRG